MLTIQNIFVSRGWLVSQLAFTNILLERLTFVLGSIFGLYTVLELDLLGHLVTGAVCLVAL